MRHGLVLLALFFAIGQGASADTLRLLDGRVVTGTFLGGDARTIRMEVDNQIVMFAISEVDTLSFGGGLASSQAPPTLDPKIAKEQEKARKKAEEQAAKAAKQAEKAQKAAAEASAKAEEAAARAKGATAAVKAPTEAPRFGRFGKPAAIEQANDAVNTAKSAPAALGNAAQTAGQTSGAVQQAAGTASQVASLASDPGAAASQAAQQAAQGVASSAGSAVTPVISDAQTISRTAQTAQDTAQAASNRVAAVRSGAGTMQAAPAAGNRAAASGPSSGVPSTQPQPSPAPGNSQTPAPQTPAPLVTAGAAGAPAPSGSITTSDGIVFRVRMVEAINTDIHKPGEIFRASLETPLATGAITAPKGADVMLRLVKMPTARPSDASLFSLEAISLRVDLRNIPFTAQLTWQPGDSLRDGADVRGGKAFHGAESLRVPSDGLLSLVIPKSALKR